MRTSRFSEHQIVAILKKADAGCWSMQCGTSTVSGLGYLLQMEDDVLRA